MKKKGSIILWVVAICVLLLASYIVYSKYKPQSSSKQPQQSNTEAGSTSQKSQKVNAPDFSLKDMDGKEVKLSDYKGKIVILNFWAVWCKYCKQEMPDLNELNTELKKTNDAVLLAVDSQESIDTVKNFLTENKIKLHVLLDTDGTVTQTYGISAFPTTFILNKDGSIYTYIPGATNKETLLGILDKVRKGEPAR
jgi:peroxiredoxin